jgi:hypothetical protein
VPKLPDEISKDKIPGLEVDAFTEDASEVPQAVMVQFIASDNIDTDLAKDNQEGLASTLSVEGAEEDPFKEETIEQSKATGTAGGGSGKVSEEACCVLPRA